MHKIDCMKDMFNECASKRCWIELLINHTISFPYLSLSLSFLFLLYLLFLP